MWEDDETAPVSNEVRERVRLVARTVADAGAIVDFDARPNFDPNEAHGLFQTLLWSAMAVRTPDADFADMVQRASEVARSEGIASDGDRLVITAGVPFGTPGMTNVLRIAWVGDTVDPI